jgi:hypothetical protein
VLALSLMAQAFIAQIANQLRKANNAVLHYR